MTDIYQLNSGRFTIHSPLWRKRRKWNSKRKIHPWISGILDFGRANRIPRSPWHEMVLGWNLYRSRTERIPASSYFIHKIKRKQGGRLLGSLHNNEEKIGCCIRKSPVGFSGTSWSKYRTHFFDFEMASIVALEKVFQNSKISLCCFHFFFQNVWRKLVDEFGKNFTLMTRLLEFGH